MLARDIGEDGAAASLAASSVLKDWALADRAGGAGALLLEPGLHARDVELVQARQRQHLQKHVTDLSACEFNGL